MRKPIRNEDKLIHPAAIWEGNHPTDQIIWPFLHFLYAYNIGRKVKRLSKERDYATTTVEKN